MPFSPVSTTLTTTNELKNISQTITYVGYVGSTGTSYPVTITPVTENATINISGGNITGYYSNVFSNEIEYRTIYLDPTMDEFQVAQYFSELDSLNVAYRIYHYNADITTRRIYAYVASANNETQTYYINVDNDWTYNRDQLSLYVNPTTTTGILWINSQGAIVPWKNTNGQTIIWTN